MRNVDVVAASQAEFIRVTQAVLPALAAAHAQQPLNDSLIQTHFATFTQAGNELALAVPALYDYAVQQSDSLKRELRRLNGTEGSLLERLQMRATVGFKRAETGRLLQEMRACEAIVLNLQNKREAIAGAAGEVAALSRQITSNDWPKLNRGLNAPGILPMQHGLAGISFDLPTSDPELKRLISDAVDAEMLRRAVADDLFASVRLAVRPKTVDAQLRELTERFVSTSKAMLVVESLAGNPEWAALLGSPDDRAKCLLSMNPESFIGLLGAVHKVVALNEDPGNTFSTGNVVARKTPDGSYKVTHRAPSPIDAMDLYAQTLEATQKTIRSQVDNELGLPEALSVAALTLQSSGSVVHALSDGNGRTMRALLYLIKHGMQQPQRQFHEFQKAISPGGIGRRYLAADHGAVAGLVLEASVLKILAPNTRDFADNDTARRLNIDNLDTNDDSVLDAVDRHLLRSFVEQDDLVPSGMAFATAYNFAKRHGYLSRVSQRAADGIVEIDPEALAVRAKKDDRLAELFADDRRNRAQVAHILLDELTNPTMLLKGCALEQHAGTLPLVWDRNEGPTVSVDDSGRLALAVKDCGEHPPKTILNGLLERDAGAEIAVERELAGPRGRTVLPIVPLAKPSTDFGPSMS